MRSVLVTSTLLWVLAGSNPAEAADRVDYAKEIKPILSARCYACHGALQQKGKLRVDTVKSLVAERDSGAVVVPGKVDESPVVERILGHGEERMPPASEGEALKTAEVDLIKRWIDQGAVAPPDDRPEPDPRDHWAFRVPVRPPVPKVDTPGPQPGNPIDAFFAAEWKAKGLKPQPPASKELLLRRVYLDLVGLPPTAAERAEFLADTRPDAYERLVDRLLTSRGHAERWARHWMDIWRYSDWWGLGAEVRNSQKHIWHWRDWIIESLTSDLGYDRMIRDMIAADEMAPGDRGRVRATGYLARGYFKFNRNTWLEDVIEHTGKAFLGLTLNCAKCHDHKYDPIDSKDYYRLRAFFEPYEVRIDQVPGQTDFEKDGIPRVFDAHLDTPTFRFARGDESKPIKDQPMSPGIPKILAFGDVTIKPVKLPVEESMPGLRDYVLADQRKHVDAQLASSLSALAKAKVEAVALKPGDKDAATRAQVRVSLTEKALEVALVQSELFKARHAADEARKAGAVGGEFISLARAAARLEKVSAVVQAEQALAVAENKAAEKPDDKELKAAKEKAASAVTTEQKALETDTDKYFSIRGAWKSAESPLDLKPDEVFTYPATSTGRRTALANWLADRRNPLTARVAVNHIWMRHFGTPLVPTVFDFGRKGTPPTHPALLDWLAVDFMEHGWSMRRLHRLIVTSDAYRRGSSSVGADPKTLAADPENRLYWRMNSRRMEAQVVRDSLLQLAGILEQTPGGPSIPASDELIPRRSLYFFHSHNDHAKFLSTFDDAGVLDCYRRAESIVPAQALALWNSKLSMTMGTKISERLNAQLGKVSDSAYATEAFRTILAVPPNSAELAACEQTLADLKPLLAKRGVADPERKAREILVQSLINHNDFITIR